MNTPNLLANLLIVSLHSNSLQVIANEIIDALHQLRRVDFRFNDCINYEASTITGFVEMRRRFVEHCSDANLLK